jgi:hypothetical protein
MSRCPYTWVKNLLTRTTGTKPGAEAQNLRVRVSRNGEERVDVALPARSARWLIELIPSEVMNQIYAEGIPIDSIQTELAGLESLFPCRIFDLNDTERKVEVWLE